LIELNNKHLKVSKKATTKKVSEDDLFDLNFDPQNHIIYENYNYEILGTTYLKCSIYEYVAENKINEITKVVYRELGVMKNGVVLVRYQVKDLYSNAAFYRTVAEIIEAEQISLEKRVKVYPSPFKNTFLLSSKSIVLPQNIVVVDVIGKDVTSQFQIIAISESKINVKVKRFLKKGIYFIKLVTDDYVVTKRVVKS